MDWAIIVYDGVFLIFLRVLSSVILPAGPANIVGAVFALRTELGLCTLPRTPILLPECPRDC